MEKKRKIDENYADVVINSLRQDDLDILPPKPETPASASTDNERAGQETASSKPSKKKPPVREAWQEGRHISALNSTTAYRKSYKW